MDTTPLDDIAQIMIYTHAGLGGIALLFGGIALSVKKGQVVHKRAGKIFFYTMLAAAIIAAVIALMPGHYNMFLLSIGIFSTYFLLSGYRSLKFKQNEFQITIDKAIAYVIIATGILMILYPVLLHNRINIVLLVFGIVGLTFGVRDLQQFRDPDTLRKNWMTLHLGKMTGGYIASVTAFLVVNDVLPSTWNWFLPGILGGAYIYYWIRKVNRSKNAI